MAAVQSYDERIPNIQEDSAFTVRSADACVVKPIDRELLIDKIETLLLE